MTEADIEDVLKALDSTYAPEFVTAATIEYLGGGGSGAWKCWADDHKLYVVKAQNNHHEPGTGPPLKVVATELICGRLGQLFRAPLTAPARVLLLPADLANSVEYPGYPGKRPTPGPCWSAEMIPGSVETKGGFNVIPQPRAAALLAFHAWLRADDAAILIDADSGEYWSIDHGWFLTGSQWAWPLLADSPIDVRWSDGQLTDRGYFSTRAHYDEFLAELMALPEEAIVASVARLPEEWGLALDRRVQIAACLLRRRDGLENALSSFWQEVA